MATRRAPYHAFNFTVTIGETAAEVGANSAFQEVSGAAFMTGRIPSRQHDAAMLVTLKRGVVEAAALYDWVDATREGATRTLRIALHDESGDVRCRWTLNGARIVRWTPGPFDATGRAVAIEELAFTHDGVIAADRE